MSKAVSNPITESLTRRINIDKQNALARRGATGAAIIIALAAASAAVLVLSRANGLLLAIVAGLVLVLLAAVPVGTAIASSMVTYQKVHGENLQFIEMTLLTNDAIVNGFAAGVKMRLMPLRRTGERMALFAAGGPFLAVLFAAAITLATAPETIAKLFIKSNLLLFSVGMFFSLFIFYVSMIHLNELAVVMGIALAIRLRWASVTLSTIAAAITMLTMEMLGPLIMMSVVVGVFSTGTKFLNMVILTFGTVLTIVPYLSEESVRVFLQWYLQRLRRSAD